MTQQQQNRLIITALFAMGIIPFSIAWYLSFTGAAPTKTTNNGKLIVPVIESQKTDYQGFDPFSADNLKELSGHWLIANVIPANDCNQICLDALYKTQKLQLMLSKDLTRTRRIVLILGDAPPQYASAWWKDDLRLLRIKPSAALAQKLKQNKVGAVNDGVLFLIDPLGNIMMYYDSGFDPYKVVKDLKKLLSASQIG